MRIKRKLAKWAWMAKQELWTIYFAARDPRTPAPVRLLALVVAAYALSPIDLIPDFIPVLGYLDDLLIVPMGLMLVVRLLPPDVLHASREKARARLERARSWAAAIVFMLIWAAVLGSLAYWLGLPERIGALF